MMKIKLSWDFLCSEGAYEYRQKKKKVRNYWHKIERYICEVALE